jgi:hypothetical protein
MEANNGVAPKIVFIDLPRSVSTLWNKSFLDFAGVEEVKNGCFFSTKYESKQVLFNPPHVMIFANNYPNLDMLTRDR